MLRAVVRRYPGGMAGLIGRDEAAEDLARILSGEARLVTVVGPGGVGKSSLAYTVAFGRAELPRVAELAPLRRSESVTAVVCEALGLADLGDREDSALPADTLLVVDNCEHVLDTIADVLAKLLRAFPSLGILATSREPLGVRDERIFPLQPLALATSEDIAEIEAAPAVRLFRERAEQAGASTTHSPDDLRTIHALCRRLDGLPLAIEIAASRARSSTPRETLARLEESLASLVLKPRAEDSRHQTLRATIEWSYALLDEDDQQLFDCLSIHPGLFSIHAAARICAALGRPRDVAHDAMDRLVNRSLVVAEPIADGTWYRLLETLAAFGRDRLVEREQLDWARDVCVDYAVALANEVREAAPAGIPSELLTRHYLSAALFREAILTCLERDDTPDRAFAVVIPLWSISVQENAEEIADLSERVVRRWPDAKHADWAQVLASLATTVGVLGRGEETRALAQTILEREPESEADHVARVIAARAVAEHCLREGDPEGIAWVDRTLEEAERSAPGFVPEMLLTRGESLSQSGRIAEALATIQEGLAQAEALGIDYAISWGRVARAWVRCVSDPASALRDATAALELAERIGFALGVGHAHQAIALSQLGLRRPTAAAQALGRALAHWRRGQMAGEIGAVLRTASTLFARIGRLEDATEVRAALGTSGRVRATWGEEPQLLATRDEAIGARLSQDRLAAAITRGESSTRRETVEWVAIRLAEIARDDAVSIEAVDTRPVSDETEEPNEPVGRASPGTDPPDEETWFRPEGDLWQLRFEGQECFVPARKGILDLARLLAQPNESLHSLELAGRTAASEDGIDALDDRARKEIRAHADRLRAEREDAEVRGDQAAIDRARSELEALEDALAASLGLGGRSRRVGSEADRARSTVTARIRAAIRQLEGVHPRLARHLAASVRTGTWCVYAPETPTEWRVD